MPALLIVHDIDDVDHWLKSPKRQELMGPRGFTVRTFVDPSDSSRVGLVVEGASLEDFQELLRSEEAPAAMKYDGVRAETIRVLEER
ncbi:MAG TPA: hypothetical protein VMT69_00480 [Kineosporiaceae bacterium]|nr:hypothetical protein [Kineosporiaceae bacterium]